MSNKFTIMGDEIFYDGVLYATINPKALETVRDFASIALLNSVSEGTDEMEELLSKEYEAGYEDGRSAAD